MDAKELRRLAEAAISNPPNDLWYLSQIDPKAVIELLDEVSNLEYRHDCLSQIIEDENNIDSAVVEEMIDDFIKNEQSHL